MILTNTTGKEQAVVIVWDREGKFFQVWSSDYNGDGIEHGQKIAKQIGGTFFCYKPIDVEQRLDEAVTFEVQQISLGNPKGFRALFEKFFSWNRERNK